MVSSPASVSTFYTTAIRSQGERQACEAHSPHRRRAGTPSGHVVVVGGGLIHFPIFTARPHSLSSIQSPAFIQYQELCSLGQGLIALRLNTEVSKALTLKFTQLQIYKPYKSPSLDTICQTYQLHNTPEHHTQTSSILRSSAHLAWCGGAQRSSYLSVTWP